MSGGNNNNGFPPPPPGSSYEIFIISQLPQHQTTHPPPHPGAVSLPINVISVAPHAFPTYAPNRDHVYLSSPSDHSISGGGTSYIVLQQQMPQPQPQHTTSLFHVQPQTTPVTPPAARASPPTPPALHPMLMGPTVAPIPTGPPAAPRVTRCYYCGEEGHKTVHCRQNPYSSTIETRQCTVHGKMRSITYLRPMPGDPRRMQCVPTNPCMEAPPGSALPPS